MHNIGIIGTGYVGLVTGNCFASMQNKVWCIDIDEAKINKLRQGICTIFETGLEELLNKNLKNENIIFSTDLMDCVKNCDVIFLCLPTPAGEDGSADLQYVLRIADTLGHLIKSLNIYEKKIIVNKSTVPVGTAHKTTEILAKHLPNDRFVVVSNPEFLCEGSAVEDSMKPHRIIIGTDDEWAVSVMRQLYAPFVTKNSSLIVMDRKSAEVTKYAANSFLATKISFMNDLSDYCEAVGANIDMIRMGIGTDNRIGNKFLLSGIGYGGSCFPKDVHALDFSAKSVNCKLKIIEAVKEVNSFQVVRFFDKIKKRFNNDLNEKRIAIWGLSYKPNTDDIRESPAHRLIEMLLKENTYITCYDPAAIENSRQVFGDKINYGNDMYSTIVDADALIICTEWDIFKNADFFVVKHRLKEKIVFDGRNIYQLDVMKNLNFEYYSVGRQAINSKI